MKKVKNNKKNCKRVTKLVNAVSCFRGWNPTTTNMSNLKIHWTRI